MSDETSRLNCNCRAGGSGNCPGGHGSEVCSWLCCMLPWLKHWGPEPQERAVARILLAAVPHPRQ